MARARELSYQTLRMTDVEDRVKQAHARFDALNAQDPHVIEVDGKLQPRELIFAHRLEQWVLRVVTRPSVALRLAARSQHLMRFSVPRRDYPEGRIGYLTWRKDLSRKHADWTTAILREVAFDDATIEAVRRIHLKQELKTNFDSQAMEDALCLSFLEHEFAEFAERHPDEKVIDIVVKTWRKMSERGHQLAHSIPFEGRAQLLIERALAPASSPE